MCTAPLWAVPPALADHCREILGLLSTDKSNYITNSQKFYIFYWNLHFVHTFHLYNKIHKANIIKY